MMRLKERFEHGTDTVKLIVGLDGDEGQSWPQDSYLDCDIEVEWWLDRGYRRDANGDGCPGSWEDEVQLGWVVVRGPDGTPLEEVSGEEARKRWPWLGVYVDHYFDAQEALREQGVLD